MAGERQARLLELVLEGLVLGLKATQDVLELAVLGAELLQGLGRLLDQDLELLETLERALHAQPRRLVPSLAVSARTSVATAVLTSTSVKVRSARPKVRRMARLILPAGRFLPS